MLITLASEHETDHCMMLTFNFFFLEEFNFTPSEGVFYRFLVCVVGTYSLFSITMAFLCGTYLCKVLGQLHTMHFLAVIKFFMFS
jgi:hypothetical protein